MSPTLSDAKKDLYKLLGLERETATEKQIKSSYRKLALKYHPDKLKSNVSDDEKQEAVDMFQQIGVAYSILSDPKKKAIYDRTGNINSDGFLDSDKDWTEYFKELWTGVVSAETIDAHAKKYRRKC
ncbi:DnaJ domain-containing protein [Radiomyces spectabilis]|uniref:DnaJ domain-containing protein n=1 Tax=Radiomyces spectabilis TaxID=64574 RepID=UPI00221FAD3D|nr:DnaJ domain-containing protein [Radiomyces spectabilis]KAI8377406.1 DnaJ domain-containing protein [Radiomyces spectabilis]